MFDFAFSEIALIGVVALVAIGPKDLPVALKTVANLVKKARKMAGEFQTHVDEMVKDTDLAEVRGHIGALRRLDIKGTIERAVDGDGAIRRTMNENPIAPSSTPAVADPTPAMDFDALTHRPPEAPPAHDIAVPADAAPAFLPPSIAHPVVPPAFVPPSAARRAA